MNKIKIKKIKRCVMCPKRTKGKRVTCGDKCLSALRTKQVAESRRKGIGWGGTKFGRPKPKNKGEVNDFE